MPVAVIVQLPFPSTTAPHPALIEYYQYYTRRFQTEVPGYFVPEGELWELPLWTAHLAGMLRQIGWEARLLDMSRSGAEIEQCYAHALESTAEGDHVLLSPLAQNFDLAVGISRRLQLAKRITVLGGNMAGLAQPGDATLIHAGRLSPQELQRLLGGTPIDTVPLRRRKELLTSIPDYSIFSDRPRRVPLLRLNASHGCLYACEFCGDAWSRQLVEVDPAVLEHEIAQFQEWFPDTRLIYIGDKTFGQSQRAVENLRALLRRHPGYRLIVQTHVLNVDDELVDTMRELGVVAAEMGFESGDAEMLRLSHKVTRGIDNYRSVIAKISAAGIRVVLNVMGGLPAEREESHLRTLEFMHDMRDLAWLYNLYNFVPYPLTPYFPKLRDRIHDWRFANWREDAPVVYQPYHLTPERSWELFLDKVQTATHAVSRGASATLPELQRRAHAG